MYWREMGSESVPLAAVRDRRSQDRFSHWMGNSFPRGSFLRGPQALARLSPRNGWQFANDSQRLPNREDFPHPRDRYRRFHEPPLSGSGNHHSRAYDRRTLEGSTSLQMPHRSESIVAATLDAF